MKFSLIVGFIVAVLFSGCTSFYMNPGTTYGEIKIGKPRVTTRERLVNDRLEEEAWLKKQLAETSNQDFSGVQGLSDIRSLTGISAKAGVGFDPGQNAIYQTQQKQQLLELQRNTEIDNLNYQITLAKKKNELAGVTGDPTITSSTEAYAPSTSPDDAMTAPTLSDTQNELNKSLAKLTSAMPNPSTIETTKAVSSPIDQFRDKLAYREEIRNEILQNALDDSHDLHNNTLYRLNFDTTIIPANDTSAWAIVNVKIDPPDIAEPTPERFAEIVNVKIADTSRAVVNAIKQSPVCALINKIDSNLSNPKERERLIPQLVTCLQDENLENVLGYFPQIKSNTKSSHSQVRNHNLLSIKNNFIISVPQKSVMRYQQITSYTNQFNQNQIKDIAEAILLKCTTGQCTLDVLVKNFVAEYFARLQINEPSGLTYEINEPSGLTYDINDISGQFKCEGQGCNNTADERGGRLKGFEYNPTTYRINPIKDKLPDANATTFMELYDVPESDRECIKLEDTNKDAKCKKKDAIRKEHISFLGATPKESVQRISDVVARRNYTELALALKGIAGTASLDTMLSYFNQTDGLFEALRRQPLVVGYTDSDAFGWLIGPKYRIEHQQHSLISSDKPLVGYRHVPIQNGVSGMISVPVFWPSIKLRVEKYWQQEDGESRKVANFSDKNGSSENNVSVDLPSRLLLAYDLFKTDLGGRAPILDNERWQSFTVTQGDSASLAILGENLWRSTMVILGGQPADKITVLPDMKGIVASFDKIKSPGFIKEGDNTPVVDLLIVASEGSKKIGKVMILKPSEKKADAAKWEIIGNRFIYPESTFTFKLDPAAISGYSKIELELVGGSLNSSQTVGSTLSTDSAIYFDSDSENFVVTIPKNFTANGLTNGAEYQTRIKIYKTPKDANPTMQSMENIVYYSDINSSKVEKEFTTNDGKIVLKFPKKFDIAYPALKGKASVEVTINYKNSNDKGQKDTGSCAISNQSYKCTVTVNDKIKSITEAVVEDGSDKYPIIK